VAELHQELVIVEEGAEQRIEELERLIGGMEQQIVEPKPFSNPRGSHHLVANLSGDLTPVSHTNSAMVEDAAAVLPTTLSLNKLDRDEMQRLYDFVHQRITSGQAAMSPATAPVVNPIVPAPVDSTLTAILSRLAGNRPASFTHSTIPGSLSSTGHAVS